nr:hypothetical protein [Tanacetum cinerariifolium]
MQNVLLNPDLIGELGKTKEVIEELETKLQVSEHPMNLGVPEDQIIAPQKQRKKGRQIKPVDGYSCVRYHQYIPWIKVNQKNITSNASITKFVKEKLRLLNRPTAKLLLYTHLNTCTREVMVIMAKVLVKESLAKVLVKESLAKIGEVDNALECLRKLREDRCVMSRFTVTGVLLVLTLKRDVWNGGGVHALVTKMGCFLVLRFVMLWLICMNLIIGVHQQSSDHDASFGPDLVTVMTMLPACSHLAVLRHGKEIHGYMITKGLGNHNSEDRADDTYINNSGFGNEELDVFRKMCETNVTPDEVTFVGVLYACFRVDMKNKSIKDKVHREKVFKVDESLDIEKLRGVLPKNDKVAGALSRKTTLLVSISNEAVGFDSIKELYASDENFCITWIEFKTKKHQGEFLILDNDLLKDYDDGSRPKEQHLVVSCSDEEIVKFPRQHTITEISGEDGSNLEEFSNVLTAEEADITGPIMEVEDEPLMMPGSERGNDEDTINKLAEEYMEHIDRGKGKNRITGEVQVTLMVLLLDHAIAKGDASTAVKLQSAIKFNGG